ncbi:hypothetical protein BKA56DRAFT_584674, partial [Ilyonectria sp. MPI-CAGE-AT-0026]
MCCSSSSSTTLLENVTGHFKILCFRLLFFFSCSMTSPLFVLSLFPPSQFAACTPSLTVPASPPCLTLGAASVGDKQKQGPRDRRRRITGHKHIRCHLIDCARPSLFRLKSRRAGSPKSQVSSPNPDRSHLHLTFPMDSGPRSFTAIPASRQGRSL